MRRYLFAMICAVLTAGVIAPSAMSQEAAPQATGAESSTMSGTVVSSSRSTLVVRTESGSYQLFVFDTYTAKPRYVTAGSVVRVISTPGPELGVRHATSITVLSAPPAVQPGTAAGTQPGAAPAKQSSTDVVPESVRQLESDIERQVRKFGAGFRAGATLDPELISVGVHARMGSFFKQNISFRPNVEFAFGEVTKLFAINLEGVYRLPFTPRTGKWSSYVGAGPGFNFSHQSFERVLGGDEEEDIDFGDFEFDAGLNILAGVEFRSGLFMEIKSTVYARPHLRLIFGYTF